MIKGIYSIHDRKTGYGNIITVEHDVKGGDDIIKRDFENLIEAKDSLYSKNPEDFSLAKLGEFDTITGAIQLLEYPDTIAWLDD